MEEGHKEILKYGATFVLLIAAFFGGSYVLKETLGSDYPMMVVISQSMIDTLGVGDFIFIQAIEDFDQVVAEGAPDGDILVFLRPGFADEYIVHRAIDRKMGPDGWLYTTKGDNNGSQDGVPVSQDRVIGKVVNRIPIIGYFSLFIKTMKGFGFVVGFMVISFFFDNILPKRDLNETGRFNIISLIPFVIPIIGVLYMWVNPGNAKNIEYLALAAWYLGSILLPLSTGDDDMGMMIWLYHFVLIMVPISCDLVWRTSHITPSMWWPLRGSTLPISWLLLEETPAFTQAFNQIFMYLMPGALIFLSLIYLKRNNIDPVYGLSKKIRGID